jgi:hypothetical protein
MYIYDKERENIYVWNLLYYFIYRATICRNTFYFIYTHSPLASNFEQIVARILTGA